MMNNKFFKGIAIALAAASIATCAVSPVFANDGMSVRFQTESASGTKMVIAGQANVRTEPSTNGGITDVLNYGDTVSIDGITDNGWYLLSGGGYVRCHLMSDGGQEHHDSRVEEGNIYYTHVNNGYVALRNAPCYDESNEIGPLWNGSEVQVIGEQQGDYVLVSVNYTASGEYGQNLDGRVGYVNASCLQ